MEIVGDLSEKIFFPR